MQNTSLAIILGVGAIYFFFAPLVLLGIYMFVGRLAEGDDSEERSRHRKPSYEEKDPAIWSPEDVRQYLKEGRKFK